MQVITASPSGALACKYTIQGGHRLHIGPEGVQGHSVESLEAEAIALVRQVRAEYSKNLLRIKEERPGASPTKADPPQTAPAEKWLRNEWLRLYRDSLDELEVTESGPAEVAEVWFGGRGDVDVRLRPDCVDYGNDAIRRALDDLTTALNAATDELWRRHVKLKQGVDDKVSEFMKEMQR